MWIVTVLGNLILDSLIFATKIPTKEFLILESNSTQKKLKIKLKRPSRFNS